MSTRAAIIQKTPTGYAGIYNHSDGYPEYLGAMLQEHYRDPAKVGRLIALGDISILYPKLEPSGPHSFNDREEGVTVAYGRDRGEQGIEAKTGPTVEAVSEQIGHNGYVYVFDGAEWTVNGKSLAVELARLN